MSTDQRYVKPEMTAMREPRAGHGATKNGGNNGNYALCFDIVTLGHPQPKKPAMQLRKTRSKMPNVSTSKSVRTTRGVNTCRCAAADDEHGHIAGERGREIGMGRG